MLTTEIDHAVLGMVLAVRCRLATLDIERRFPRAGLMCTALVANIDHADLCMSPAVRCYLAAFDIE